MTKRIVHIIAVCLAGLIAGGQYVVSFDYCPTGVSASLYTEKIQYAIHHIGTPLFGMLIAAFALNFLAAVMYRKDRRTCGLLAGAAICLLIGGLITRFGNIPLLDIMDTWQVSSPPANWQEIAGRWYMFHSVRLVIDIAALLMSVLSIFTRR
jgi:hypothetical protein